VNGLVRHHAMKWDVWKVYYMTYAESAEFGDRPRDLIARGLSLESALAMVERLGFGHSAHPETYIRRRHDYKARGQRHGNTKTNAGTVAADGA